jgi:hypothetical protein
VLWVAVGAPQTRYLRSSNSDRPWPSTIADHDAQLVEETRSWVLLTGSGFVVQEVAQSIEPGFPALTPVGDPLLGRGHRRRLYPAHARPADFPGLHDTARLEYLNMLDHGRQGHGERTRQFAYGSRAQGEAFHHGSPAAISQRVEGPIEVDRLVKYLSLEAAHINSQVET